MTEKKTFEMDVDGDGRPDTVQVEQNADGSTTYLVDTTGDGKANIHGIDKDGDGVIDEVRIDSDGDGIADERVTDL
ncbi:MAG TPA: hypothetical protein VE172_03445 [Stackebrandtia sp.]|jgi:hypothetical protein|uniref:hypothetical protein n=1 Tax=Stackebrandtia sp. TaxID=2023065 RepID=UPI002D6C9EC0|nr:hypothetical protein [Stackebrandtia sp.]HZE37842.1 hypothetical protein [Stackebrandtia sp.]